MELNSSQLNDLASVDIMFAEMMAESGVNPIPSVCDNCDMSILYQDNKSVSKAFINAETNLGKLVESLNTCMDLENKDSIIRLIDNLTEKQNLITNSKPNFSKSDFNFIELYTELKKIQNKLGINFCCPEMNILSMTEENFDTEKAKEKLIKAAKEIDDFMKESEKQFQEFLNAERSLDNEFMSDKVKQKIEETKKRKQMQHENAIRLNHTFTRHTMHDSSLSR